MNYFCGDYDGIVLYAEDGCDDFYFQYRNGEVFYESPVIITHDYQGLWVYQSLSCNIRYLRFWVYFSFRVPPSEPWTQDEMELCQSTMRLWAQDFPQDDYTYLWTTGETTPYIDISNTGVYGVTVTNSCGDSISDQISIVQNHPLHEPFLLDTIYFCQGESVVLDPGDGFTYYLWSNGSQDSSLVVTQPGEYWVQTINEYGCNGYANTNVQYLDLQSIDEFSPAVTIDTVNWTGHLMVVWDTSSPHIQQVMIYREALTNQWNQVGVADYSVGYFIDEVDGSERSYRYKLSATDICGGQAELGRTYQSMNAAYLGPGVQYWWIQWTPYKIADINAADHYELYSVDNLQDFNISQVNAPIEYENTLGFYYVNLPHGIQDSVFFVKAYIKNQYGGGSVMSNFVQNYELLDVEEINEATFSIYPNPAKGSFKVEGSGLMTITNVLGQMVMVKSIEGEAHIELPRGLFFVKLGGRVRKIVVE